MGNVAGGKRRFSVAENGTPGRVSLIGGGGGEGAFGRHAGGRGEACRTNGRSRGVSNGVLCVSVGVRRHAGGKVRQPQRDPVKVTHPPGTGVARHAADRGNESAPC